ncbi:hypothetical protein HMPREF0072_1420 [Anaerococcus lactolyticus ATCC 51172]|uniref:Uncharacterized protein n=1 Tax=Anaerococcus lactolyticus ATCC 51172 TaxID=525254 RepID=C2BGF0_9FIRM|nr:hypothetical protein [Anaerococcus lactolyticus]EEI86077.1 hypothetical protein HMPREF0072_1420 [Anaerococcus lactolyticus ATCC 51172]
MTRGEILYAFLSLALGIILVVGIVRVKRLLKSINDKIDKL